MSFSKNDLEKIKSKIQLSTELEKKTKVIKKGKDYWCCCPFHEEKTPSCKINDDMGSYYCFGCGAKGDIFTLYTNMYNFSFPDAVKELAQRVGIKISDENFKQDNKNEIVLKILQTSAEWFESNLLKDKKCLQYLKNRSLSKNTIKFFKIGYSYNSETNLYNFLKKNNFKDEDILRSNVVKKDKNNKIRDFFYKRLMFPICNEYNKIVGFGGRVLDNSNPKYINSPESIFFKKRDILYNLNNSKNNIRQKNNMLICEGYMDVISLYENNIKTAVAPLGTALTENQIKLSWKFVNKPTIMFDGDNSGIKASYKTALMSLPLLNPNKYVQFIKLPKDYDPDSYINKYSIKNFIKILKKPISLVEFIFEESSSSIDLKNADNKITFDKYLDDLINTIKDDKIKYFYKNEFKTLFFNHLKNKDTKKKINQLPEASSIKNKQISSFIATFLNHKKVRREIFNLLNKSELIGYDQQLLLDYFNKNDFFDKDVKDINLDQIPKIVQDIIKNCMKNDIFQLFPYSHEDYSSDLALSEVEESLKNLNTRLSNLKKINKSLIKMEDNSSSISWEELKKISFELHYSVEN